LEIREGDGVAAPRRRPKLPLLVLGALWLAVTFGLGALTLQHPPGPDGLVPPILVLGAALSAALLWGLPGPSFAGMPLRVGWRRFLPLALACALLLIWPSTVVDNPWQYLAPLVAVAATATVLLRSSLSRGEVAYALVLAVVAGVAGLGSGRNAVYMAPALWGLLQVGLTFFGFLAGWALMRRLGLFERGMGRVLLLTLGPRAALRGAGEGVLLAVPFTIILVALGATGTEGWVVAWWQPLVALQPGMAEEAWGRVFPLAAMMFVLRTGASLRAAWLAALVVGIYWFANLHNFFLGIGGIAAVTSAVLVGVLFALPLTYVWLRRGQEAAIGFHFTMDFGKFVAALLINTGIWV
jgi:hypothetical protein